MVINDVLSELQSLSNPAKVLIFKRFFKTAPGQYGAGDQFLGLTVPQIRSVVKKYWQSLTLADLDQLLRSPYHEHRTVALASLCHQFSKFKNQQKSIFNFYLKHTSRINNWDLVDISALNIVGAYLLEQINRSILTTLSQSKSIWERRISIISTLTFIKNGQFGDTLAISKTLINDPEDLLHKAVGWMLREVGKCDLKTLLNFLDEYATRLPRTALRYSIEKLPEAQRQYYLHLSS
ncbi:MAG: DNA alkylation repair protein [Candidatus Shapirobacteria bacterium]